MTEKRLFLLDGHALVFRAHYAFIARPLYNSKGLNTSAITGFVRSLWDIICNHKPTHIAVAFDRSGPTFRNDIYPEYKANRDATPEDIVAAMPYIKDIVEGFNIPIISLEGYEADDLIGTLAKQAENEGFNVFMVTPDKDYAQLVSDKVFMWKPSRQGQGVDILGEKEVLEKWDIERVDQVIDVLGLQGDAVDNIPGVPGVGPKTAVKLLKEFADIEGVIANADQLKGKLKERIVEHAEQARMSRVLATIDVKSPVTFDAAAYELSQKNEDALSIIFKDLEFRSLAQAILQPKQVEAVQGDLFGGNTQVVTTAPNIKKHDIADASINSTDHDYKLVSNTQELTTLIKKISSAELIAIDTETTGLDAQTAELVGISIATKEHEGYYIHVSDKYEEVMIFLAPLREFLNTTSIPLIGQNIKYDLSILTRYQINPIADTHDTMLMHYLLEPTLRHNMDYLSETYLKYKPISITSLIGEKGKKQLSMRSISAEKLVDYAAEDADITFQLYQYFAPILKTEKLDDIYNKIERPLVPVLADMESNGVYIDKDFLEHYSHELADEIRKEESSIYKTADVVFNISSPKQVGEVLFDKLEIPYRWKRNKSGSYSTSEEKLAELAPAHEIISDILNYRSMSKLKSTYVDALPKMINPKTGLIHSSFNQALAATGRLSSNNPNLQNIPIKTPAGRKVREAFIPRSGDHILLAADYSQIELRLIADIAKEEAMLEAFSNNQDIHTATASHVFNVPYEEVTPDQRRMAKTVNFSIIYGAGSTNLSRQLNIKRDEASKLIKQYFEGYKGLKKYMDDTVEFARKNGFVTTLMGRKRKLPDINSRNRMASSGAERVAVNTPIQGSAADMIKLAMIDIHAYLKNGNFKSKMIMQVHDELVFDVVKTELDEIKPVIEEKMKNAMPGLTVPILVGMDIGINWLEAH